MKNIVIPTDFSDTAQNAVDFVVNRARVFPVNITLLHSYEVTGSFSTDYLGVNREFNQSRMADLRKELLLLKEKIRYREGLEAHTRLSTVSLTDSLADEKFSAKADLIVMGTLGAGGIKEKFWGSNTSAVIGKTNVPVMVIPHGYRWKKPRNILVATGFFERDTRILDYIFELAGLYMANVSFLVFSESKDENGEKYIENSSKMSRYEEFLKGRYPEEDLRTIHLYGENFQEGLQNYVDRNGIDMLVMVTYQNGFLSRLFNPSRTKRMSLHTRIPLLAIPAGME